MRISDWSSDVCSSDRLTILGLAASGCTHQVSQPISIDDALSRELAGAPKNPPSLEALQEIPAVKDGNTGVEGMPEVRVTALRSAAQSFGARGGLAWRSPRSEEQTSELQSLMRISYAVLCLKTKQHTKNK